MKNKKIRFTQLVKILIQSWGVQVGFIVWIILVFIVVSKMNFENGLGDFDKTLNEENENSRNIIVFPAGLIAPNPPTK